jgi:hypothetical protein
MGFMASALPLFKIAPSLYAIYYRGDLSKTSLKTKKSANCGKLGEVNG